MFNFSTNNEIFNINNDNVAMPSDLKVLNRGKILSVIRNSDKITVNDVAEQTGISRQTVVKSVENFCKIGLVLSLGKGNSTNVGGKKPEIFKFNENFKYNICVRIENNSIIVALMNLKSEILTYLVKEHNTNQDLDTILLDFSKLYNEILEKHNLTEEDIYGVGFCTGGICNMNTGIMRYNSLYPSWGQDIPIVDLIKKYVNNNIIVLVANDAKMTGMSEILSNADLLSKKFVAIYTYEGISAGVINKGSLVLGNHTLVGEIGHMTVNIFDKEVCQCGNIGCFEKLVSEERLYNMITENQNIYKKSKLYKFGKDLKLQNYFDCADKGDSLAIEIVEYLAKNFSVVLKNICIIADPDIIIIQGNYSTAGRVFKRELERNLSYFKYFPDNMTNFIIYSDGEIFKKALMGLSVTLNESLFKRI